MKYGAMRSTGRGTGVAAWTRVGTNEHGEEEVVEHPLTLWSSGGVY